MAANPRIVTNDIMLTWDNVTVFVPAGTIVDVPAGSALETAYGLSNLSSMSGSQQSGDAQGGDQPDVEPLAGGGSDVSLCSPSSE